MIFQTKAKVIKNIEVTPKYCKIFLSAPKIAKAAKPGQFLQIKVSAGNTPLLRRPLGVHNVSAGKIVVLFEIVGEGTQILSQIKAGQYLDIIGPLGNGFSVSGSRLAVIAAGGMGVAPLVFLAAKLIRKPQTANRKPLVLIGAKTKSQIACEDEFRRLGCEVKIATDDGSKGFKGYVSELLKDILRKPQTANRKPMIYACGPRPMLKEIAVISKQYKIPAQISLEEHMACGIGACLGCVVNTRKGYKRVCKEGPVFNAQEIVW